MGKRESHVAVEVEEARGDGDSKEAAGAVRRSARLRTAAAARRAPPEGRGGRSTSTW